MKVESFIRKVDVSMHISRHLMGDGHTETHHKITGVILMIIGVSIVKLLSVYESFIIHISADIIGYGLHGIGLIPFAVKFEPNSKTVKSKLYEPENTANPEDLREIQDEPHSTGPI